MYLPHVGPQRRSSVRECGRYVRSTNGESEESLYQQKNLVDLLSSPWGDDSRVLWVVCLNTDSIKGKGEWIAASVIEMRFCAHAWRERNGTTRSQSLQSLPDFVHSHPSLGIYLRCVRCLSQLQRCVTLPFLVFATRGLMNRLSLTSRCKNTYGEIKDYIGASSPKHYPQPSLCDQLSA